MTLTKNKLIEIAKEMDIKGIAKFTKQQLVDYIINNPCVNLTKEECEKMKREELRVIARKCNVLLGKKKQTSICNEITEKFSNKKKTLVDLGGESVYKKAKGVKVPVENQKSKKNIGGHSLSNPLDKNIGGHSLSNPLDKPIKGKVQKPKKMQ